MRKEAAPLLLAYYGDDFTGSSDALDFLSKAGVKTVLFIAPPTPVQLEKYQGIQAIGIAGMTRSMAPAEMERELESAFGMLKETGARQVHYKVCSTFDSSPKIGSIGKALEVGLDVFQTPYASLLVAAPALGRYCAFGNLFARMGIGSQGEIYRLDRHPSMSKHPTTPADESDLRLHLAKQTSLKVGLVDLLEVENGGSLLEKALDREVAKGAKIVLFDAMYSRQMAGIGQMIDEAGKDKIHFSVGSSGVEMALGDYWKEKGILQQGKAWENPGKVTPMLVLSGSCSPITEEQIAYALSRGFEEVSLDPERLAKDPEVILENAGKVVEKMKGGKSVIVHTACGADDKRRNITRKILIEQGIAPEDVSAKTADFFGHALGEIARMAAEEFPFKRLLIAGGDTSSKVARALGIEAVEMIAPLVPGAPLCKAHAPQSPMDGMEVNFKGGQVGAEDYFVQVMEGRIGG
ncbi:four-carbon acid sugar kinase family protein [Echinicola strongylocentroti]|uniref:Four-carbon acid sugar kinase family protein n=1 Tax=Echinicola strongylocentroti TaxID=1795355 RepID=A0A2Z4IJ93_9BACT|nr:four-carbon acid sugar kinase family protein [Echinicola strongylocentroti]AWW31212.1 four-carbon acid sugar kinase family protein [Echinicola strongylocentroti]